MRGPQWKRDSGPHAALLHALALVSSFCDLRSEHTSDFFIPKVDIDFLLLSLSASQHGCVRQVWKGNYTGNDPPEAQGKSVGLKYFIFILNVRVHACMPLCVCALRVCVCVSVVGLCM